VNRPYVHPVALEDGREQTIVRLTRFMGETLARDFAANARRSPVLPLVQRRVYVVATTRVDRQNDAGAVVVRELWGNVVPFETLEEATAFADHVEGAGGVVAVIHAVDLCEWQGGR
jgi:hypothetical protein